MDGSKKKVEGIRSFDVPDDLIFNILRRLPTKSIKRFNCVCKQWRSLLSETKKLLMIQRRYREIKSAIKFVDLESESVQQQIDFPVECSYLNAIGCCDGLLCIFVHVDEEEAAILWNPSSGKYKRVPLPKHDDVFSDYVIGFGCHRSTLDYKIVKFYQKRRRRRRRPYDNREDCETFSEIYSLNTDSWEQGEVKLMPHGFLGLEIISVNGAFYRICSCDSILRFDLTDHKFSMIHLPAVFSEKSIRASDLCDFGGRLCIKKYCDGNTGIYKIEIWIMEEETQNWIKQMSIIPDFSLKLVGVPVKQYKVTDMDIVCFKNDNEVVVSIDIQDRVWPYLLRIKLLLYNREDNSFKKFDLQEEEWWFDSLEEGLCCRQFLQYTKTPIYSPLPLE